MSAEILIHFFLDVEITSRSRIDPSVHSNLHEKSPNGQGRKGHENPEMKQFSFMMCGGDDSRDHPLTE
jgi:hypothetical protein